MFWRRQRTNEITVGKTGQTGTVACCPTRHADQRWCIARAVRRSGARVHTGVEEVDADNFVIATCIRASSLSTIGAALLWQCVEELRKLFALRISATSRGAAT